jgi:iron complex transport system substrate-binding protein
MQQIAGDRVNTIGKGAFIPEIIEAAGGESIPWDIAQVWPEVRLEAVVARARKRRCLCTADVGTSRVTGSSFPAPVAIDALENLARQLHP